MSQTVIVDEVHAVAGTKRGAHLALSLERLDIMLQRPAQRIGLSATVRPPEEVARFLSGASPDHHRRAAGGQDVRPVGAGAGARHGQPGEQHDLAGRRGAHRRPDRGAQFDDRVRELPAAGRATDRAAQRDSRRTVRASTAPPPNPRLPAVRRRTSWPAGRRRRRAGAGPRAPRLGQQGAARRRRGRPQERAAAKRWWRRPASNSASTWARSIW